MEFKVTSEEDKIIYLETKINKARLYANYIDYIIDNSIKDEKDKSKLLVVYDYFVDKINAYNLQIDSAKLRIEYLKKKKKKTSYL